MSGVFLSYSRADRPLADRVVRGLRRLGIAVWWDEDMPGVNWQRELGRQIDVLAAVLVLWTPVSVASDNVADEARLGKSKKKLVNATNGVASPPFPFDAINALPLDGWNGRDPHNGWTRLIKTIEDHLCRAGAIEAGALTRALAYREDSIRAKWQEVFDTEEAYQVAKSKEGAASAAEADAAEALRIAEEQLGWVVDKHGSATLLRAAHTDLENALAAKVGAEQSLRLAAGDLATAARAMTRAKAAFERMFDEAALPAPPAQIPQAGEPAHLRTDPPHTPVAAGAVRARRLDHASRPDGLPAPLPPKPSSSSASGPIMSGLGPHAVPPRPEPGQEAPADRDVEDAEAVKAAWDRLIDRLANRS